MNFCLHTTCVPGVCGGQKGHPLIQVTVSWYVGAGGSNSGLCKSNEFFKPLNHLSSLQVDVCSQPPHRVMHCSSWCCIDLESECISCLESPTQVRPSEAPGSLEINSSVFSPSILPFTASVILSPERFLLSFPVPAVQEGKFSSWRALGLVACL